VAERRSQRTDPVWPAVYQIRVEGHLGHALTVWFAGLSIALEDNGDTLLTGAVVDHAALYGLLKRVRDLGVPLVSVNRLEPGPAPQPTEEGDRDVH
jgi:hypothetical protein